MANELSLTLTFYYSKGGQIIDRETGLSLVTISGTETLAAAASVATSAGALDIPASPGYVFIKNLDGTNFVQVGPDGTNWLISLDPGQWALFPLDSGSDLYAKADTSACNVEYIALSA